MEPTGLTIEILKNIRDEIRLTRTDLSTRIDDLRTELSGRIDETNSRLGGLERLHMEAEIRVATELVAVSGGMNLLLESLRADRAVGRRLEDHERRIHAIEERVG